MKKHTIRVWISRGWYHIVYGISFVLMSFICSCSSSRTVSKGKADTENETEKTDEKGTDIASKDEVTTINMEEFQSLGIETPDIRLMYGVQIPQPENELSSRETDATIEMVRELSKLSSEQLDSLARKRVADLHNPIASAPKAGGRINGHVLDIDGNVIKCKVKVCERDIVDRAVNIYYADYDDGFFNLFGIRSLEDCLTFEAEGYETQRYPIDRSTYEVRLKPLSDNNK